jgi:hypothetical protein
MSIKRDPDFDANFGAVNTTRAGRRALFSMQHRVTHAEVLDRSQRWRAIRCQHASTECSGLSKARTVTQICNISQSRPKAAPSKETMFHVRIYRRGDSSGMSPDRVGAIARDSATC